MRQVEATAKTIGIPSLRAKQNIEVTGVGRKFSGVYYCHSVQHKIDGHGYSCELKLKKNALGKGAGDKAGDTQGSANEKEPQSNADAAVPRSEMVTIDAAKGLGLENEIGSLEAGKKADIILIDMLKPHLYPLNMPAYRVAYFANGADIDTVIVDGKILMQSRQVNTVDEMDVLQKAQKETDLAFSRAGLQSLFDLPEKFWGHSRY